MLVVLTCLHSHQSVLTRQIPLINRSRAYSIFVLRALSELAGITLAGAIGVSLERVKWALIAKGSGGRAVKEREAGYVGGRSEVVRGGSMRAGRRGKGARFLDVLALQEDTTILGLFTLACGPDVGSMRMRALSSIRLVLTVIVPILGVVIMSQVDINVAYAVETRLDPVPGYGMVPINPTAAVEFTGFADLLISSKYSRFLNDPFQSIDLTPPNMRETAACDLMRPPPEHSAACKRTYFFPGESLFIAPTLRASTAFPDADTMVMTDHRGYLFEYDAGDPNYKFDSENDCHTYSSRFLGVDVGAVTLCVANPILMSSMRVSVDHVPDLSS